MEPHFSPYYTGWTSMPDWHFTVKFHLPEHTSILFGSLLQTLVPQRLRACAQLYALSQKGQDTVNEVKHLCLPFTEGWPWTFFVCAIS